MSSCIARASLWRHLGQSSGPYTGPVVNLPRPERRLLSYRDRPSRQTLLTLLSQRHRLAVLSTAIRVVNQSESIYKILKPVLALAHLHRVKLHMYIDDSLLNPGTHHEALEQTSWLKSLCRKLGLVFKPREVGSNPFLGCHVSGDRAGHLCRPRGHHTRGWPIGFRSGGIHSTAVTTCCPVAPSTWTPSLSRETSALWSRVALMSDNTSAVTYLRNQGGTKSLAMSDFATDICLCSEKRGMTLVPCYLPVHLNVLMDHLSRRGQILKTEWSLNQTIRGSVRPRE